MSKLILIIFLFIFLGCDSKKPSKPKKELLIYCGTTMIKPMLEIKKIIEKQENCKIYISKGGSGNLLKSLKLSKIGDLYFPGSDSYIQKSKKEGLVTDTTFLGYNQAAIMVQKGNPKKISNNLANFTNKNLFVVIGNPESGSIGKETKKILQKKGIFKKTLSNARFLTTDSKKLFQVLDDKEADLVINWYAVSVWPEHQSSITSLKINPKFVQKKKLVLGLLKSSKHSDIAKKIMNYASSEKGQQIFSKYGLGRE